MGWDERETADYDKVKKRQRDKNSTDGWPDEKAGQNLVRYEPFDAINSKGCTASRVENDNKDPPKI